MYVTRCLLKCEFCEEDSLCLAKCNDGLDAQTFMTNIMYIIAFEHARV